MRLSRSASQTSQASVLHPVYLRLLCETLRRHALDVPALLAAAGLHPDCIGEAAPPVNCPQVLTLLRLVNHQCRDPLLPIEWGRRMRPNTHGNVGTAIFASSTVRQGLRTAVELAPLRSTAMRLNLREDSQWARLEWQPALPVHGLADFLATVVAFVAIEVLRGLLGRRIARVCVEFPFPPPVWAQDRRQHCPSEAQFHAPQLAFRLPREFLDLAVPSADAHTHKMAMRQCHLELRGTKSKLSERMVAFLAGHAGVYPSLEATARHFHVSPRTLRRTLRQEGESFQGLLDQVRMDAARFMLRESGLSVQQIADAVGYGDPSNFIRAFRRHAGETPMMFRRRQAPAAPRAGAG